VNGLIIPNFRGSGGLFIDISPIAASNTRVSSERIWWRRRSPDYSAMREPVFGADGMRGVIGRFG
jgi:hypothetical protein